MAFPSKTSAYGVWKLGEISSYTSQTYYNWPTDIIEINMWGAGGAGGTVGGWSLAAAGGAGGAASAILKYPTHATT